MECLLALWITDCNYSSNNPIQFSDIQAKVLNLVASFEKKKKEDNY